MPTGQAQCSVFCQHTCSFRKRRERAKSPSTRSNTGGGLNPRRVPRRRSPELRQVRKLHDCRRERCEKQKCRHLPYPHPCPPPAQPEPGPGEASLAARSERSSKSPDMLRMRSNVSVENFLRLSDCPLGRSRTRGASRTVRGTGASARKNAAASSCSDRPRVRGPRCAFLRAARRSRTARRAHFTAAGPHTCRRLR